MRRPIANGAACLSLRGLTYRQVAELLAVSPDYVKQLVSEHKIPHTYRRNGSHPRKIAALSPEAVNTLLKILSSKK